MRICRDNKLVIKRSTIKIPALKCFVAVFVKKLDFFPLFYIANGFYN